MSAFLHALRGEWTKFRSVRSTALCLVAAVAVTVLLELLGSTAGKTDANEQPRFSDQAYFVHKPLSGDGTIIARVVSQRNTASYALSSARSTRQRRRRSPKAVTGSGFRPMYRPKMRRAITTRMRSTTAPVARPSSSATRWYDVPAR